jgi:ABC-type transport system substrate-binding protein
MMKRLRSRLFGLLATLALGMALAPAAHAQEKVLRYPFPIAETGMDPVQLSDLYSSALIHQIFDAPLQYDFLARPAKVAPNTAALPEVSDDGRTFTLKIKPGIYFIDDPVFKGSRRELTAADYVYSVKRHFDPRWKSPNFYLLEGYLAGLDDLRKQAQASGRFDYDKEVEGLRALDRYTLRVRLTKPNFNFLYYFTYCNLFCAVAREVVEHYGYKMPEHPVGTGPYRLVAWKRSSKLVFEKNPGYREEVYEAQPPADDARGQAIAQRMAGKRLPLIDRVEVSIVEEPQPYWLAFLNEQFDLITGIPAEFLNTAVPNGKLAPHLARRGVQADRLLNMDLTFTYFNMEHPVVGGYSPEKVALRRAISLGYDNEQEVRILYRDNAVQAQSVVAPGAYGYDPQFRSDAVEYDPAKARALLDTYGYVDRNGDGWRENPDGSPLVLEFASVPSGDAKAFDELWKKSMDAIGLRMVFKIAKWPEHLKASKAGRLMMWGLGWSAAIPDGDAFFALLYGGNSGQSNHSRFRLAEFDRLYERARPLPDGPERNALYFDMKRLAAAYAPLKLGVHRISTGLSQPWLIGYHRHPVSRQLWKYLDIDHDARKKP